MICHHGFTLIEVLISLLLLSFILFGFEAMEIASTRSLHATYYFHVASNQVISMTERLRAIGSHSYLNEEVQIWNDQNKELLPKGEGTVTGHYPVYTVSIYWGNKVGLCHQIQFGEDGCIELQVKL